MQHSRELAEIEERLQTTQTQLQATQGQLGASTRETATARDLLDDAKARHHTQVAAAAAEAGSLEGQVKDLASQVQDLRRFKTQATEQQQLVAEAKQQAAQAQTAVLALQEQRKQLQSENIELKEELEHLYKHQQLLTTLQQQQQHNMVGSHAYPLAATTEPKLDVSIMEALKKQNRLIEDKCRMLQDNSMKMMKDFALVHQAAPASGGGGGGGGGVLVVVVLLLCHNLLIFLLLVSNIRPNFSLVILMYKYCNITPCSRKSCLTFILLSIKRTVQKIMKERSKGHDESEENW